jgi:3',5'-cyclic AMP phosphodiesterase CpdA
MIEVIHVSDLHFNNDGGDAAAEQLLERVYDRYFNNLHTHLLVTGDVVDDGTEGQYEKAAHALSRFAGRLLMTPGNHDCGALGNFYDPAALHRWREHFEPMTTNCTRSADKVPTETMLDVDGERLICFGLNSNLLTVSPLDFACGEVGQPQLDDLLFLLNRAAFMDVPTLVYLHHRPRGIAWPESLVMALKDGPAFLEAVEGVVDVVAYGHSGDSVELQYHRPQPATSLTHDTYYSDANTSVGTQTCNRIVVTGIDVRVVRCDPVTGQEVVP